MKATKQLLLANRAWATELTDEKPDYFSRQAVGQRPQFLWIGCSDSRVSPEQMTQSQPGGLYTHRNVGNLVQDGDLNLLSVIQYAVDELEVPNIVLCGHHGCAGMHAALSGGIDGPMDRWLENARAVAHAHAGELDAVPEEQRVDRLVEMNVRDQLLHLARTATVQAAFAAGRDLTLHGWVYDIRDGLLKPLLEIDRHTAIDQVGRPEAVLL
ncbi:carbonic anhydrase [Sphingomonas rubra]|uniref:carbonic anhydrase n=1 Tax=Sphingomonas rubra TaxID=634430 RepID=A0A1I5SWT8_9SPHN|nr:carbonic anhydrase [Sphingomonas rubra]SFP75245.1 carbonic anhydrase [Sphingomonas rubra]